MLTQSSSFLNESIVQPNSFIFSSFAASMHCFLVEPTSMFFGVYYVVFILIIFPLCILIFHHGRQRWGQNCLSTLTPSMSHNDCFTYQLTAMEVLGGVGCFLCCCGIYGNDSLPISFGFFPWSFSWYGETFFHILTCVERFLAVVHPITYQSLRKEKGIRYRQKIIVLVWLLCFAVTISMACKPIISNSLVMTLGLIAIFFCSLSVLFVLNYIGPGGKLGLGKKPDKRKQTAFYTILAIQGSLILRFTASVIWFVAIVLDLNNKCLLIASVVWLCLPSSLVLPLHFLHRNVKKNALEQQSGGKRSGEVKPPQEYISTKEI